LEKINKNDVAGKIEELVFNFIRQAGLVEKHFVPHANITINPFPYKGTNGRTFVVTDSLQSAMIKLEKLKEAAEKFLIFKVSQKTKSDSRTEEVIFFVPENMSDEIRGEIVKQLGMLSDEGFLGLLEESELIQGLLMVEKT